MTRTPEQKIADWCRALEAVGYDTETARRIATEAEART